MNDKNKALNAYEAWLSDPLIDSQTKQELEQIAGDLHDIEDRFYKELEFGTGGLRGVIGAGTNRMNRYTIGKATQGLAAYVQSQVGGAAGAENADRARPSVVIAYDSRHQSPQFALEAALVLAGNGIRAYLFDELRPTPELSFAVRELNATAGIVITASHNPPEYNGYKVYGADGGQLVTEAANQVIGHIRDIHSLAEIKQLAAADAESAGLLSWLSTDMDERYIQAVKAMSLNGPVNPQFNEKVRIVFTPLHGTGNKPIRNVLAEIGCSQVYIVKEQEEPDPNFSTVTSPNPEEKAAFTLAIKLAEEKDADVIIGTDPDCDRMGAVVRNKDGEFIILSGNQTGALLTHYILSRMKTAGKLPTNGVVIKTIVTSELGANIAHSYSIPTINTLTGFKYIGELMSQFERTGEKQFLFGYEESYGYLAGTYARDKDAVIAAMLICEAAAYYKNEGKTLYDILEQLYEQHGYFLEELQTRTLKGKTGVAIIQHMMHTFRDEPPMDVAGIRVIETKDYAQGIEGLPQENVLKYSLEDGSWFCLRPSGTEPKIKVYFSVVSASAEQSAKQMQQLVNAVMSRLDAITL